MARSVYCIKHARDLSKNDDEKKKLENSFLYINEFLSCVCVCVHPCVCSNRNASVRSARRARIIVKLVGLVSVAVLPRKMNPVVNAGARLCCYKKKINESSSSSSSRRPGRSRRATVNYYCQHTRARAHTTTRIFIRTENDDDDEDDDDHLIFIVFVAVRLLSFAVNRSRFPAATSYDNTYNTTIAAPRFSGFPTVSTNARDNITYNITISNGGFSYFVFL